MSLVFRANIQTDWACFSVFSFSDRVLLGTQACFKLLCKSPKGWGYWYVPHPDGLGSLCCCKKKITVTRINLGEERVSLILQVTLHHWGKQGRNSKRYLRQKQGRATAFWLAPGSGLSGFLIQPRTTCQRNGVTHSGLGPPPPTDMPTGQSNLSVTAGCAKLRIKANQDTSYAWEFLEETCHVAYAAFKLTL